MSFSLMKECLDRVNSIDNWSLALIHYDHKTRPNEYTCYSLNFETDELLKNTINEMCINFKKVIAKYENNVQEYTGYNSKNIIDKLDINNLLISNAWQSLIQSLNVFDDTTDLKDIKPNSFVFTGTYQNEQGEVHNIYLISRKNPILTYKKGKTKIFASRHNTIQEVEEPLVQFGKCFDALVYKNVIYMINNNCESIFNLEYSHKIICKKSLELLENAMIIDDFDSYKKFALLGQTPKKFITFDPSIIDRIKCKENIKILVEELHIPYNEQTQKFDLSDINHAQNFTKAICGKTKYNMFFDGLCEVTSSMPLTID